MDTNNLTPVVAESPIEFVARSGNLIPNELLDTLAALNVSSYELERMRFVRRVTADKQSTVTTMNKLVGADLRDKEVYVYVSNWEDSGWEIASGAITVEVEGHDFMFRFPAEFDACWNGDCDHDLETGDECFDIPIARGMTLSALTEVIVTW